MNRVGGKTSGALQRLFQLLRFTRLLLPYWDKQVVLYLCLFFSMVFGLAQPYLSRLAIDFALMGRDLYLFNMLVLIGAVLYLFSIPIELIQKSLSFYVRTRVSFDLRSRFYRHLHLLSLRFAQSRTTGEHLYRLGPDLENVVSLVVDTMPSLLLFPLRLVVLLGICLWLSWPLTLGVLAVSPIIYLHVRFFSKKQYDVLKETTKASQEVSSRLQESLALMKWVKVFGRERAEWRRYLGDLASLIRLNVRSIRLSLVQGESSRLLNAVLVGGITYLLGYQVIQGRLTLGLMTALTIYLFQLLSALKAIGGFYNDVYLKFIAMERVAQTLDAQVELKERSRPIRIRNPRGEITLEKVTFGYVPDRPVLKEISLHLRVGETVALVGPSGAGKTTLSSLLLRLYDPWEGRILLDGYDLRDLSIRETRRMIGFVSHEPFLLKATLGENLRFGKPAATEEEMFQALRLAEVDHVVDRLPRGLHTDMGEGGIILSQGEKQRVAIARAILMSPRVLILDEAMAALNSDHEQRILENLRGCEKGWTLILISHRLSAIQGAERVYVLKGGSLVEEGTPSTLMVKQGLYAQLFREQYSREVFPHDPHFSAGVA